MQCEARGTVSINRPLIVELAPSKGLPTPQGGVDAELGQTQWQLAPLGCLDGTHGWFVTEKADFESQSSAQIWA